MKRNIKNKITPLCLGTVQLGIKYGIANQTGKPDVEVGHDILQKAIDLGVTTWDTSRHYGDSEGVIGSFLDNSTYEPLLISKFKWSNGALQDPLVATKEAFAHVQQSLRTLKRNSLPLMLYHTDKDQNICDVMSILPSVLASLKDEGYIEEGGISLYYPEDINHILDVEQIAAVQVPMNVFDQRLLTNNIMQKLIDSQKCVFARSVFLQGLFFLGADEIPPNLNAAGPYLAELNYLAKQADMTVAQFAFAFIRDIDGVDSVIFGADNANQVEQNVQLLNTPSIPEEIRERAENIFQQMDEKIITPGLWSIS